MKTQNYIVSMLVIIASMIVFSCSKKEELIPLNNTTTSTTTNRLKAVPVNPSNKVAYYAFDATPVNQSKLSLIDFTDNANIVVVFEGTIFELGDTAHYGSSSSYMLTINGGPYKYFKQIIDDIHTLRARGVKVLMNVDDASSWQTTTPFTDYTGTGKTYTEYASLVNQMAQNVPFDGIALDVEHFSGSANTNFTNLVREFGKYFGPLSSDPDNTLYTAAIYSGAAAGNAIGKNVTTASYFNFVMDMGYGGDYQSRFTQYSNTIGNGKVMDGMSYQYDSQSTATAYCAWAKALSPAAAGVMVFAGNVNKTYTDAIFAAIVPTAPGAASSPSPATDATGIITAPTLSWTAGSGASSHNVYFGTSSSPTSIGNQSGTTYTPGTLTANTKYYWRIDEVNSTGTTTGTVWNFTTGSSSTGGTAISLSSSFNVSYGIVTDGTTFTSTSGLDGEGYAYSSTSVGSTITWNNTVFNRGPVNASDVVKGTGQTITLTSGNFSYLRILATSVGGNITSQSFVVTYSDGTTSTFSQSVSDWCSPQSYSGESKAVTMTYRDKYDGTEPSIANYLYGYSFSLTSTKTISSIKLPNNSKLRVLAMTLVP
jgi:hypothetical protein